MVLHRERNLPVFTHTSNEGAALASPGSASHPPPPYMRIPMRHAAAIITCTALATFMCRLDTNIVAIALPTIADHYQVNAADAANLMLYYLLTISMLLLPLGSLGDRIGFRTLLLAGYGVFTLGSLACGLAGSLGMLTASRVLQGAGAAMMVVSAYSIIPRQLPLDRVGRAMGLLGTAGSVGVLLGAPLGGALTGWLTWRSIFLVNIPLGLAALWLVRRSISRDRPGPESAQGRAPFDWTGCLLGAGCVLLVTLGLDMLRNAEHWRLPATLLATGLLLAALLVRHLRRSPSPLFSPSIFAHAPYRRALGAQGFTFMAIAGHGFALPFYLDRVLGLAPQQAGLVMTLFPLGVSVAAPLAGRLSDRFSPRLVLMAGAGGNAAATTLFAAALHSGAHWAIYPYLPVLGLCFGAFLAPSAKLLLAELRQASQGIATSLFNTVNNVSLTMGVAMSALLFTAARESDAHASLTPQAFFTVYAALACCCLGAAVLTGKNLAGAREQAPGS